MAVVRNLMVRAGANFAQITTATRQAQTTLQNFQNKVGNTMGKIRNILIAIGIGAVIKDSIQEAMNAVESENLFEVSMGKMANQARAWSMELQDSLGLNGYNVRKNVGMLNQMASSMGLNSKQAYDMSTGLTKLAYDMASFYNITDDEAIQKIQSGISGEAEPLKRLGILVNETTTKTYAWTHGIAKQGQVLTEQQKVLARYGVIMDATKNAQGDLARTINSPANQLRLLTTRLGLLRINIGNAFMPIVQRVLPILNSFVQRLITTTDHISQFMQALFGKSQMTSQTSNVDDQADSVNKLGDAYKKTGKKATTALAGIDEINNIKSSSIAADDNDNVDIPGATASTGNLFGVKNIKDTISPQLNKMAQNIRKIFSDLVKPLQSIDFKPLEKSLGTLKEAFKPLGKKLFEGLYWLYINVLVPLTKWTISKFIPTFINLLASQFKVINSVLNIFKPIFLWVWDHFFVPIAKWTAGLVIENMKSLTKYYNLLATGLDTGRTKVGTALKGLLEWGGSKVANVSQTITSTFNTIKTLTTSKWGETKNWFKTNVTDPTSALFGGIKNKACEGFTGILTFINGDFLKAWTKVWGEVVKFFKNPFKGIVDFVKGIVNELIKGVNYMIKMLDKIKIPEIDIMGKKIGGWKFVDIKPIPKLATGGIVTKATNAIIGESGAEAVMPLENNTQWIDKLASKLNSKSGMSGNITIQIGDEVIGKIAINHINKTYKMTGRNPLIT